MKCYNCNNEFEGNFCPKCGVPADNTYTQENPYEQNYARVNNYQPPVDYQPQYNYQQPQNYPPQQPYQQGYVQPQQYVPQVPVKQGMSGGKVAALVIGIFLAIILFYFIVPLGCFACLESIDDEYSQSVDTAYHGMGSSVNAGYFIYRLTSAEYNDTYDGKDAGNGMQYVTINVEVENTSDKIFKNEVYCTLYADDYMANEIDTTFPDDFDSITLPPGKKGNYKIVCKIPKQFEKLELFMETEEYDSPYREYTFTFTIENQ